MKKIFLIPFLLFLLSGCTDQKDINFNNVKVIAFDFDGTLVDTLAAAIQCVQILADEYGFEPIDTETFRNSSIKEIMSKNIGWYNFYLIPGILTRAYNIFKESQNEIIMFDGIKELIQILSTKYEVAIISSSSEERVLQTLEKYGISSEIKHIYTGSKLFGKDTTIKNFLKTNHISAEEFVYVGDEIRDIEACKKVGVKIIAVTWGLNSKQALEKSAPDYLVDSRDELAKIIDLIFV